MERPGRKPRASVATPVQVESAPAEPAPAAEGAVPTPDGLPADPVAAVLANPPEPSRETSAAEPTAEAAGALAPAFAAPLPEPDVQPPGIGEAQPAVLIDAAPPALSVEPAPTRSELPEAPPGSAGLQPADQPDPAAHIVAAPSAEPGQPATEAISARNESSEPVAETPPISAVAAPLPADHASAPTDPDHPAEESSASSSAAVSSEPSPADDSAPLPPAVVLSPTVSTDSAERVWAAAEAALADEPPDDDEDAGDDPAAANAALLGERRRPAKDDTWFASGSDEDDDEEEPAKDDVAAANAALLAEQASVEDDVPAPTPALADDALPANDDGSSITVTTAPPEGEVVDDEDADHDPGLIAALAEALPALQRHDHQLGAETLGRLAALIPDAAVDDADDVVEAEAAPQPAAEPAATTPDDGETVVRIAAVASHPVEAEEDEVESTFADPGDDEDTEADQVAAVLDPVTDAPVAARPVDAIPALPVVIPSAPSAPAEVIESTPAIVAAAQDQPAPLTVAASQPATSAVAAVPPPAPKPTSIEVTDPFDEPTVVVSPLATETTGLDSIDDPAVVAAAAHATAAADVDAITADIAPEPAPVLPVPTEPDASETVVRIGALAAHPAVDPDDACEFELETSARTDPIPAPPAAIPSAPSDDEDVVRVANRAGDPALDDGDEPAPTTVPDDHETVLRIAALAGHDAAEPGDEDGPPPDIPPDPPDGPPPTAPPPPASTAITETTPTDTAPMPAPPITRIRPWLLIAASLALVNALGWFGYVWLVRLPRAVLEVATPSAVLPGEAWTWRFNLDVVADLVVGTTPEHLPTIEPAVPGAWTWRDRRTLEFAPAVELPPATTFLVRLPARDLRSASGFRLAEDLICAVRTPALRAEGVRQVTFSADGAYTVDLAFDRPVDPAALAGRIVVEPADGGDPLPVTTTTTTRGSSLRLAVGPSPAHDGRQARVRLTPAPAGPARLDGPLRLDPSWSAPIGLGHRLALREAVASAPTRGDPTLTLRFADREVPLDLAARLVRVEPAVPFTARAAGGALVLSGAFVPGETYQVAIDAAWPEGANPAHDLAAYPAAGAAEVAVGDRAPGAWFVRDGERLRLGAVNLGSATLAIIADDGGQVGSHLLDLAGTRNAATLLDLALDDLLAGLPPGDYRLVLAASDGELAAQAVAVRDTPLSALRLAMVIERWTSDLARGDASAMPTLRLTIPGP